MSKYFPHQIQASDELYARLKQKGVVLLAGEMRTGKTRTAIRTAEMSKAQEILVITKKAAIAGWDKELSAVGVTKNYTVTNYEQAAKLKPVYDLCIVDESHAIGRAGKPTQRFKTLRAITFQKPLILLSGTPAVESLLAYYYQFALSAFSPLPQKNFYEFFALWGRPSPIRLHGRWVEQYKEADPKLLDYLEPWIIPLTQADAGIQHTATDVVHTVQLDPSTVALIETIQQDKVATVAGQMIGFDSDIKERTTVHQIESGAVLIDDRLEMLPNNEVVDYIKTTWGDSPTLALMAHYRSTRKKLEQHFPQAHIFSSIAHSEGVDLSGYKDFVIVNTCYSGAKHLQRRDRVVNLNRTTAAVVNHIVCEGGISPDVYEAVSQKRDFNISQYRRLCASNSYNPKSSSTLSQKAV